MGEVARLLGKPLMPWQQYVADVILEIDPDTGRLAYSEFGLTVPRQSGKSTLILAKAVHRASASKFFGDRQRLVYTAQTRQKAREKWEEDFAADLEASRVFRSKVAIHKGNGNEHVRFVNGSRFGIEANTEKAGHGGTLDEAYIDEAFAQPDNRLEQAFGPAMITRRNKQLGWVSTAGWLGASPYLAEKCQMGRAAVEADTGRGVAYFEWSANPEHDPGDPVGWRECMPALGYTITEADIRAEFEKAVLANKLSDFNRAYRNLWVPKVTDETDVFGGKWAALADPDAERGQSPVFGVATAPDRSWSAIAVAWKRPDGSIQVMLSDYERTTTWVNARLAELRTRWNGRTITDTASRALGIQAETPAEGEQARGQNALADAVTAGTVRHGNQTALNLAVKGAAWKPSGNTRVLDRKGNLDISPLAAAALAVDGVLNAPTSTGWMVSLP